MINCIKITLATLAVHVLIQWPRAHILGGIYSLHTCPRVSGRQQLRYSSYFDGVSREMPQACSRLNSTRFSQKTGAKKEYSDPFLANKRSPCRKDHGTGRWPRLLPQGWREGGFVEPPFPNARLGSQFLFRKHSDADTQEEKDGTNNCLA